MRLEFQSNSGNILMEMKLNYTIEGNKTIEGNARLDIKLKCGKY